MQRLLILVFLYCSITTAQIPLKGRRPVTAPELLSGLTAGSSYYVATNGDDSYSCMLPAPNADLTDGPCRTLTHAQTLMQSGLKTTQVRGGLYTLEAILSFTSADNNEVWQAYDAETPVIDGNNGSYYINISGTTNLALLGFMLQNMYGSGASAASIVACQPGLAACSQITLRWNTFVSCNFACIMGAGLFYSEIDSNTILAQSNKSGAGILLFSFPNGNQITHNLVTNCQGAAINVQGNATDTDHNNNNVIDRNVISNVNNGSLQSDDGAIYLVDQSGMATGNQITNNLISGNGGSAPYKNEVKCIYLDDETSNTLVQGNICGPRLGEFGFQIHGGRNNLIQNNIFDISTSNTQLGLYQSTATLPDYGMAGNIVTHNIFYTSIAWPSYLWIVGFSRMDNCSNSGPVVIENDYSSTNPNVSDIACIVDPAPLIQNPGFKNPATADYTMSNPPVWWIPVATDQGPLPYQP